MRAGPVMPESEGEKYHIVTMEWFGKWKNYTGYAKIASKVTPGSLDGITDDGRSTNNQDEDT